MNNRSKNIIMGFAMLAACIPYACKLPYVVTAWQQSPLDSHDWIFILLGFASLGIALFGIRKEKVHFDWTALFFLLPFAFLYVLGFIKEIHAVSIMAGVLFAAAMTCLLWGWECFIILAPTFLVFCLSVTSTTYWFTNILTPMGINGLTAKFILAFVAIAGTIVQLHFHYIPKKPTSLFVCALCFAFILVAFVQKTNIKSASFIPDFSTCMFPSAIGREVQPTAGDLQFFQGSKLEKYFFATSDNSYISVLSLTLGTNVHQIHPPSHCLRVSGNHIHTEQLLKTDLRIMNFTVTEITSSNNQQKLLVWFWYSNKEYATASFLSFRKSWNAKQEWHSYQISTPIFKDNLNEARERMRIFLAEVLQKSVPQTP